MYKKVLYNIKKIKKMWGGGGGGAIFDPARIRPYDLRVRNPLG